MSSGGPPPPEDEPVQLLGQHGDMAKFEAKAPAEDAMHSRQTCSRRPSSPEGSAGSGGPYLWHAPGQLGRKRLQALLLREGRPRTAGFRQAPELKGVLQGVRRANAARRRRTSIMHYSFKQASDFLRIVVALPSMVATRCPGCSRTA